VLPCLVLAACGAKPAAPPTVADEPPAVRTDHTMMRGDLRQFLPHNATQAWFLDIAGVPPGPLFDRALATICPRYCELMARHARADLRTAIDSAMLIGADGEDPYHIVIAVRPRASFGVDFLGETARRTHRGVDIATWDVEGTPVDVALVHGHLLFGVAGGIEPFIQRALETGYPPSDFDEALAEGVVDTQFWLLHVNPDVWFNIAADLAPSIDVEVRLTFPDEGAATAWFRQLDPINDAMWSSLNLPETGRTFQRYLRGRVAGVTFQPSVDEALHLTREGVMGRMAGRQGVGARPSQPAGP
jgi:hypothetical protein